MGIPFVIVSNQGAETMEDVKDPRRRRRKKKSDEQSVSSISTISKKVDDESVGEILEDDVIDKEKKTRESEQEESSVKITKSKKTKKKRDKKSSDTANCETEEDLGEKRARARRRRKKKNESLSSNEEEEAKSREERGKRRKKKVGSGLESQVREDFYSDPRLVVTLQGLEDDMYSINGDGDMTTLSPSPLLPSLPASQPVAKIFLEKQAGFSKTSVSALSTVTVATDVSGSSKQQSPLGLGLSTQKVFHALCVFSHGLLAGLGVWQVFTVYSLHQEDLHFVSLYSPLAQPLQITFYLLTVVCTVSVCDRYDLAQFDLSNLQKMVTLRSGGITLIIYWTTLLLTLVTSKIDDKLSLHQHNSSLFGDMEEEDRSYQLEVWKAMNLCRCVAAVLGWFIISLRPSTDLLYKHLKSLQTRGRIY